MYSCGMPRIIPRHQPAAGHAVEHGVFLGDPDRIVDGDEVADHGDLRLRRLIGEGAADNVAVGHQAVGAEVVLVAAHPVKAAFLRFDHALHVAAVELVRPLGIEIPVGKRPVVRLAFEPGVGHEVEEAELQTISFVQEMCWLIVPIE